MREDIGTGTGHAPRQRAGVGSAVAGPASADTGRSAAPDERPDAPSLAAAGLPIAILEAVAFVARHLLEAPRWEEVIEEALAVLGKATDASRVYVFENHRTRDGELACSQRHEWVARGISPEIQNPALQGQRWSSSPFRRWTGILERGDVIAGPVRDLPDEERDDLALQDIRSILIVPVSVGRDWWGTVGFDDCRTERIWHQAEIDALRAAAGALGAAVERRRADERLAGAERRYRALVDRIPAVTYIDAAIDPARDPVDLVFVSPQIEELLGYPIEEWREDPRRWLALLHPEDRRSVVGHVERSLSTGERPPIEYRLLARDGRSVWVRDEASLIRDEDATPRFWQGMLLDITERREAEDALRDAEARFRAVVEHIPAATYTETPSDDGEPVMTYISPQIEPMFGYPIEDWIGDPTFWQRLVHPDDLARVLAEADRTTRSDEPYRIEYRVRAWDGRVLWVRDEARLVRDVDGTGRFWQGFLFDITERRNAEEALREAEARYRAIVEHIPAIIYTEDVDAEGRGRIAYVSPQIEAVLGYRPEDWVRHRGFWSERIHPADRERVLEANRQADESGGKFEIEYRFQAADGRHVWLRDEATLVPSSDGSSAFWQGFLLDVTERKLAEEALADAEAKFRTIVEQNPAAIYTQVIDEEDPSVTKTTYISPKCFEITGYTVEETLANPELWRDMIHPDDLQRVSAEDVAGNVEGRPVFDMEYRILRKDGGVRWVHDKAVLVRDHHGHPRFWQGFQLNITERKRTEDALRESEQRYRDLFENANDVFYTFDLDRRITSINRTGERVLGRSRDELIGTPIDGLLPPEHVHVLREMQERKLQGAPSTSYEIEFLGAGGNRIPMEVSTRLLRAEGRPVGIQAIARDITERRRAERDLEAALEVERAANEMKDTFLQAVSHDLKTPLAAIHGLAITLGREDLELDPADVRDLAGRIAANTGKLDKLVSDLLDLDRIGRGALEPNLVPADLGALVRRVVAESEAAAGRVVGVEAEPVIVPIDPPKVERILENLLANSARHTPSETSVWVSVRAAEGGAELRVEDDGSGVPEADRGKIFEPFHRGADARGTGPGVGIGLALVARFAALHGGRAWVTEREGGGASFRVFLPSSGPVRDPRDRQG